MTEFVSALLGGALVGAASLLMLLFNGRILGISGIVGGLWKRSTEERGWRLLFLLGLLAGGVLLRLAEPQAFLDSLHRPAALLIAAGLLVGYGTRLGSGCTSGHGICGVSRLSPRSIVATVTFMFFGVLTVFLLRHVFGSVP